MEEERPGTPTHGGHHRHRSRRQVVDRQEVVHAVVDQRVVQQQLHLAIVLGVRLQVLRYIRIVRRTHSSLSTHVRVLPGLGGIDAHHLVSVIDEELLFHTHIRANRQDGQPLAQVREKVRHDWRERAGDRSYRESERLSG